ncbi:CPBP family intramembrane glutamic endopeptidase [Uliginosibacterium sp. H1]|uniref:CPBP family intramembrane glutamic endopeptidase n=1 Tax=Uliginosibacterium sp. H1 TaxID=3114757 RepID=UPI002E197CA0|nr:CPBP family intramembrane glutamic endopeptidase [Uliginosibacterium sp. H1]
MPTPSPASGTARHAHVADAQYSLATIAAVWFIVTLPMATLAWIVVPWLVPHVALPAGIVFWLAMIAGMAWQFVVAVVLLRRERRHWNWPALKERLWLQPPALPGSGRRSHRPWLWVLPGILFVALSSDLLGDTLDTPLHWLGARLPGLMPPAYTDIHALVSPAFAGRWYLLGIALCSNLFNYLLGETLLFHGVLLPKMEGVFGRRAWLANAVIFGLYHLHKPLHLVSGIISNMAYSLPAQRYRCLWLAVLIHGFEGLVVLGFTLWVVLGQPAP